MGLLHVASFGQMCPLFAAISNLRAPHCLLALQLAPHPDLSKSHKADIDNHHFPPLTINDDEDDGSVNYNDDFALVAGTCSETKKMYQGGFFLNWQMMMCRLRIQKLKIGH